MDDIHSRTQLLVGKEGVERLKSAHVLVVGLGGVGAYAAEMLCRAGVGHLTIVDGDVVNESNLNRQLVALHSTIGLKKGQVLKDRLVDVNPQCQIEAVDMFLKDDRLISLLEAQRYDFVIDAIDTLSPKVFLLYHAHRLGLPIVSSMGSAGKLDPTRIHISDIAESTVCPLAAMVRKYLHKLGVRTGIQVVFSTEKVIRGSVVEDFGENKRTTVGTISYLPPIFGCCCASVAIRGLINQKNENN
ncbi:MAG: tRNA threonylcarbamoyladenosine dehydratase [Bacteroidales bacterium]|nr:tRNA threonylcarbamoyladenosine dehydratase [Bacteroidales bacterium]